MSTDNSLSSVGVKESSVFPLTLSLFYIQPIRLLMLCGNAQDEERLDDITLLDVPIAIFPHIKIYRIIAMSTTIVGKRGHSHRIVRLQDKRLATSFTQCSSDTSARISKFHRLRVVNQRQLNKAITTLPLSTKDKGITRQ